MLYEIEDRVGEGRVGEGERFGVDFCHFCMGVVWLGVEWWCWCFIASSRRKGSGVRSLLYGMGGEEVGGLCQKGFFSESFIAPNSRGGLRNSAREERRELRSLASFPKRMSTKRSVSPASSMDENTNKLARTEEERDSPSSVETSEGEESAAPPDSSDVDATKKGKRVEEIKSIKVMYEEGTTLKGWPADEQDAVLYPFKAELNDKVYLWRVILLPLLELLRELTRR